MTKCVVCGKEFDPNVVFRKMYCSSECAIKSRTHGKTVLTNKSPFCYGTAICKTCGKEFNKKSSNHEYCSRRCSRGIVLEKKVCPVCKKKFRGKKNERCCSRTCKSLWPKLKYRLDHGTETIERECPVCHKRFSTVIKGKVYCGQECKNMAHMVSMYLMDGKESKFREHRTCVECGKDFVATNVRQRCCCLSCFEGYLSHD